MDIKYGILLRLPVSIACSSAVAQLLANLLRNNQSFFDLCHLLLHYMYIVVSTVYCYNNLRLNRTLEQNTRSKDSFLCRQFLINRRWKSLQNQSTNSQPQTRIIHHMCYLSYTG